MSQVKDFNIGGSFEQPLFLPLFEEKGIEVFAKRDDLIHPIVSGNKWRKLKFTIQKAISLNKNHLVTFGGAYSNHLLATACAGAVLGLKTTGFVRGDEEIKDNHYMLLMKMYGMEIIKVSRSEYKNKLALFNGKFGQDKNAYFVDEGGSSLEGEIGCQEIITELNSTYDYIVLSIGTGTTAKGLVKGVHSLGSTTKVLGIDVLKGIDRSDLVDLGILVNSDYNFGGYGKYNSELTDFMTYFISSTGILVDQVYTAKMFFALFELIKKDYFAKGSKILALHTGGNLGLLSMVF